jgi:hypothetical protein
MSPDRRAVAMGLLAGAAAAPAWSWAEPAEAPTAHAPETPVPDSVLATSVDLTGRMTVPVMINGRGPFPFVIDTGSNRTVVSDALASHLALPSSGMLQVRGATALAKTPSVRVRDLAVGLRRIADLQAPVMGLDNLGALGMLGIDAVADQRLIMDFRKHQMTLARTVRREPDANTVVVAAKSRYGQLLLVDSDAEGVPLYVIIDTGSENTLGNRAMREFLARRRIREVEVLGVTGDQAVADLGVGKVLVRHQEIAYADLYIFEHLGLHGKPSMLLGMSTLRQCAKVSIDFPAREVRFLVE